VTCVIAPSASTARRIPIRDTATIASRKLTTMNMTDDVLESLRRILDYLHDDEMKNWDENDCPTDHIYIDIRRVMNWLNISV
jgi:hypothetical protein